MSTYNKLFFNILTLRTRNTPYGVYGKTETHHMVFLDIVFWCTKLIVQCLSQ